MKHLLQGLYDVNTPALTEKREVLLKPQGT